MDQQIHELGMYVTSCHAADALLRDFSRGLANPPGAVGGPPDLNEGLQASAFRSGSIGLSVRQVTQIVE